jgi:anti-sigma regulatory factor (Ser/Thr protein kinase)
MNMPAHDAPSSRCDRCGRRHGYEGCASARVSVYSTGPHPTGPHTSGSTPRVSLPPAHPGHGPGWSTGQQGALTPTLHSGPQPTYRATTGPQPTYLAPVTGQQPAYRPPATGQQPAYRAAATGQQPAYQAAATGPQPAYRAPATGPQAAYRGPTGPQPVHRSPATGPQGAFRPPAGPQGGYGSPASGQQPAYATTGSQPAYRGSATGQQPAYRPPTGQQPAFRSPSTDPAVRPGGYVQPTYPPPSPAQHHATRSGRNPAVPSSQAFLPGHLGAQPAASPLDWTGQLGGWSLGVSKVHLDTTGAGETSLWGDRADDRLTRSPHDRDTGSFPRAQHTDHLWPSVTTDPFGMSTQAAVRAEQRERSRTASFGFQLHMHTPRRARRHTVEFAEYWGLDDLVEAAELVVSELMTNALEASLPGLDRQGVSMAVAPLELRLSAEGRHLRIEIRDHNPDPPVLEEPDVDEERGRGLLLVDSYCDVWGYHRLPTGGKVVWCLIGPPADA